MRTNPFETQTTSLHLNSDGMQENLLFTEEIQCEYENMCMYVYIYINVNVHTHTCVCVGVCWVLGALGDRDSHKPGELYAEPQLLRRLRLRL